MGNRRNIRTNAHSNTTPRQSRRQEAPQRHGAAWFGIIAIVMLLVVAAYLRLVPRVVPAIYAVFSVGAFVAYALDKSAARNGQWRTPENTLHLLAVIGGWPGALLAQSVLRHKSKKKSFQTVFWLTVFTNCGAFGWLVWLRFKGAI